MDKEIMAKINEALKANGRRELSMDEADNVVGGCVMDFGEFKVIDMSDATYLCYTFIPMLEKYWNKDIIAEMLTEATIRAGAPSKAFENAYVDAGKDGLHNAIGLLFDKGGNGFI